MRTNRTQVRLARTGARVAALTALLLWSTRGDAAPVTEKTPGIDGPATTQAGAVDFLFAHIFSLIGPKVINSPTFLLDAGVFSWGSVGVRYGSRSTIATRPNELEMVGKISALSTTREQPLDVSLLGGYDTAANSGIGELLIGRELGPIGLLGALRGFTAGYAYGGATGAAALGLRVKLTRYFYLVGDVSRVLGAHHWDRIKDTSNRFGWSGGIAFIIPYSPHSVSLYATNLNSHSVMESSRGLDGWMMGFEFDVPFESAKRWAAIFSPPPKPSAAAPPGAEAQVVDVEMKAMAFSPARLTVTAGTTVRWINRDAVPHTATGNDKTWDSGTMDTGATWSRVFDTPGTYHYICTLHPFMVGEIVVEAKSAGAAAK